MNKLSIIILLSCSLCAAVTGIAHAASPAKNISEGNRYYSQEKYDNALEKYQAAGEESADSDIAHFNIGAARYKKGEYEEAIDSFTRALNTEDKKIESDATYNIANAKYQLGSVNADRDLNSAVSLYRESLDYYKRAMEMDEHNTDAKYNHELVERELKVLLDKLKNQQQQDDQEQDRKDQQESETQQATSDQQKENGETPQKESGKDQEMKEDQEDRTAEEDTGQEAGQQEEGNGEMTPGEAQMLLEAYGAEEKDALTKKKRAYYPEVLKDW